MSTDLTAFYERWKGDRPRINREVPYLGRDFATMYKSVMKDGALSLREKELIAAAISVALRCEPCINLHTRGCIKAGATREQVLEAAAVAAMMQGGPGLVYVPQVLRVLDHLENGASS
jgi:AhpD family alkylhydroperoxidase